jgi:hypothetical protein
VRALLAPPPLSLSLRLPSPLSGASVLPFQTVPRLVRLQPLVQPGMLCPCHSQPLVAPPPTASDGWLALELWRCAASGRAPEGGAPSVACGADGAGLLQLGAHTLLRMPPGGMAEAAGRGFSRDLGPEEVVPLVAEAALPREALDAQLLLAPAVLAVPRPGAPGQQAGGGEAGEGAESVDGRAAAELCASLRARGALLLCSCAVDLDARRALPLRQWYAAQPGGSGGAALLLWRLAPREALLPLDDLVYAAASAGSCREGSPAGQGDCGAGGCDGAGLGSQPGGGLAQRPAAAGAAAAEAEALLDGLSGGDAARALLAPWVGSSGAPAALGLEGGPPLLALPMGLCEWADRLVRGSNGVYVAPPQPQSPQQLPAARQGQQQLDQGKRGAGGDDAGHQGAGAASGAEAGAASGRAPGGGRGSGGPTGRRGAGGQSPGSAPRPPTAGAPRGGKGGLSLTRRPSGRRV